MTSRNIDNEELTLRIKLPSVIEALQNESARFQVVHIRVIHILTDYNYYSKLIYFFQAKYLYLYKLSK